MINKFWFYFLSFTWGILVTLAGCITSLVLLIAGYQPKKNSYGWVFIIGKTWGGVSIGPCRLLGSECESDYMKKHEFGHSIQNCFYGPFMIFLVVIPSTIRYWYYKYHYAKGTISKLRPYDDIWFEHQANVLGEKNYEVC